MDADVLAFAAAVIGAVVLTPTVLRVIDRVPVLAWAGADAGPESGVDPATRTRVVRLLLPLLFGLGGWHWGASSVLVPFLFLFATLVVVSAIDAEHYRIPDRVVFPALGTSMALIVAVSLYEGAPQHIKSALVGAVAYFLLLLVPHLIYPRGLGFGDVKLALLMGLYLGWIYSGLFEAVALAMWALVIGSGLGVLVGVGVAVVRRRRAEFPFGPSLAAGCVLAIFFAESIVS